jgi:hypothetical protein
MSPLTIPAHFDGERIQLDEPVELKPNARLVVTVLPADADDEAWNEFALRAFEAGYGDEEPEYTMEDLKWVNPEYEGR